MRLRTIGLAAALSTALFQTSSAVVQPKGAEGPVVAAGKAPRAHRTTQWARAAQLTADGLPGWTAMMDRDTNVPLRMWGEGVFFANAMTNPAIAESAARQFLAAHIDLLAPGSQISDFVMVANQLGGAGDVRSVGFQQMAGGLRVLGGSVGFSFKNDRLVMVGSTALPDVRIAAQPPTRLGGARVASSARGWLAQDGHEVAISGSTADRVIVPIVHARGAGGVDIAYRLAEQLSVSSTTSDVGRWDVWVDATDASPILRKSTIMYASGKVLFDVPDRHPTGTRSAKVAPQARHGVDTVATVSDVDGLVTWAGTAAASVSPGLVGPLVAITNKAGTLTTEMLSLADGGSVTWSKATEEFNDSQLSSFVFASTAKAYVRANLNPSLAWLDGPISVTVNETSTCNAYSTGDDIHFYRATQPSTTGSATTQCQNTGRIADVVYHEFGHSVHANSIIEGVGQFDGSLSEGLADRRAAFITDDHGMGRGFFFNDMALRDLDPTGTEKRWPDDADGEVHDEGEIIGETLWDLKKALVAKLGAAAGNTQARKIYYGVMQRSADIPSTYAEALVSDDNDGNLANGTPNLCAINAAFGAHGLADPAVALGLTVPVRDAFTISMSARPPSGAAECASATITKATVEWKKRDGEMKTVELAATGDDYSGVIPTQPEGTVVQYKVTVTLSDGSSISYPNNAADPLYEFYVGEVTKLWCADFEAGASDWTHGALPANRDEWEVGAPQGLGGDPHKAHGGTNVFGIDLSIDGQYRRSAMMWAESPEVDLQGNTNVRLQYYRWLGVEDGFFDNARIMANGTKMWSNFASPTETMNGKDHLDKEWRFQDVDLSSQAATGKVKLRFELDSDTGVNLAGWNLDDVCIVSAAPAPTCGNGVLDEGETCDDGNIDNGDACSATCTDPSASDDPGCCSVGATPGGAAFLSMLTFGMLIRRRRRA
ncbi:hypothetical protein BH11MYX3_BH11MYX3_24780 [soil metagenome]